MFNLRITEIEAFVPSENLLVKLLSDVHVEIATYTYEMIQRYVTNELMDESALQEDYRRVFAKAMGPLGLQWHGEIRSLISTNALNRDANWFLA